MRAFLMFAAVSVGTAVVALALADEPRQERVIDASRALDAGTHVQPLPDVPITKTPVDPEPLVAKSQWVFDLRWDRGDVWLLGAHPLELPAPQATPRVMGRFALELFEGPTLIERVRFDFPLMAADSPDGGLAFASKLRSRIGVVFPTTKRGTRLELWDRASNRRWSLPWPPPEPDATPPPADAGAPG